MTVLAALTGALSDAWTLLIWILGAMLFGPIGGILWVAFVPTWRTSDHQSFVYGILAGVILWSMFFGALFS